MKNRFTLWKDLKNRGRQKLNKMKAIVAAALEFNDVDLTKVTRSYLQSVGTGLAISLADDLQNGFSNCTKRSKRRTSIYWDDSYIGFNLVASQSDRNNDVQLYPYHKAYCSIIRVLSTQPTTTELYSNKQNIYVQWIAPSVSNKYCTTSE